MIEALKSAWLGWQQYTDNGKLPALLLAVLVFLVIGRGLESRLKKQLFLYAACMGILCICPLTAAALMRYQTGFYAYQWIWNMVPVTLMIAFGGTVFLVGIWENYKVEYKRWAKNSLRMKAALKPVGLTLFCIGILILCGNMGTNEQFQMRQAQIEKTLETAVNAEAFTQNPPCIFAPSEVMEYARAYSGGITLPYGRNMWDSDLNAYIYDTYDTSVRDMYLWMSEVEDRVDKPWKEPEPIDEKWESKSKECFRSAAAAGVNIIILPEGVPMELIAKVEQLLQSAAQRADGYYIFYLPA